MIKKCCSGNKEISKIMSFETRIHEMEKFFFVKNMKNMEER